MSTNERVAPRAAPGRLDLSLNVDDNEGGGPIAGPDQGADAPVRRLRSLAETLGQRGDLNVVFDVFAGASHGETMTRSIPHALQLASV